MRGFLKRLFTRRRAARALAALAILVATLLVSTPVLIWIVNIRGERIWRAYQAEAKSRGVKLELREFLPSPLADEQDFAAIPIFEEAFENSRNDVEPLHSLDLPSGDRPKFGGGVVVAQLTDLESFQRFFVKAKLLPPESVDSQAAGKAVLQALARYEPELAQLREASFRPHACFPVDWELTALAKYPHYSVLQAAVALTLLRAAALIEEADTGAAIEELETVLRWRRHIAEPSLLAGVVSMSFAASAGNVVYQGLATHRWRDDDLQRIERALGSLNLLASYASSLAGERALQNLFVEQLANRGAPARDRILAAMTQGSEFSDGRSGRASWLALVPGWLRENQTLSNRYYDEMLARVDPEAGRYFADRPTPSSPRHINGMLQRYYYLWHCVSAGIFPVMEERVVYQQTILAMTRLACALERFRLARGAHPETLQALVPDFLPVLPNDVFANQPFRYRKSDDGEFQFYALGKNGIDDGGTVGTETGREASRESSKRKRQTNWSKQLDWVWEYPAR
ncbi:MAG: hypothetical protein M3463_10340 [Verrucomicrobiota bacterium]|nr:hypothetical protein [Verrucomicrobiota bacterium]